MAASQARCPHLGFDDIQGRAANRPDAAHCCWATGTPEQVSRREQAQRCLSARWVQCPLLQPRPESLHFQPAAPRSQPALPPVGILPASDRPESPQPSVSPVVWMAALVPFVAAAVAFGWLTWQALTSSTSISSALAHNPALSAPVDSRAPAGQPDASAAATDVTATATESAFIPLRAVESSESAPDVAADGDERTATPAPVPTKQPTPIVTPGPFPAPASSPPTHILAPAINLDTSVTEVGTYFVQEGRYLVRYHEVADYAAGWHNDSALPGAVGNTVLAGHNNTRGEVFRYVSELEPGDMIYLQAEGRQYPYRVAKKMILPEKFVSPEQQYQNARWIAPTDDRRLTLITCWPYVGNTHRVVVVALPFDAGTGEVAQRQ